MQAKIEDPCVQECFSPKSQWKFINIAECLQNCKQITITKP
ncbi:MAG: hypothetical protein QXH75_06910 [Sulfolobaceae archaeon]|jgi:hypothetical protein